MDQVLGGWSETKVATAEIQKICDQVKEQVEKLTGEDYEAFKAVQYRSQVVEGTNYIIKIDVGVNYLHVLVFQALPCYGGGLKVIGVQKDKTKDDPLEIFDC